jgi:ABC-type sugar transport system substrate-binding protein
MKRLLLVLFVALTLTGCGKPVSNKIGFMPKLTGIPYFNACKKGAEEAAAELKVDLVYNGPASADANKQIDILNHWIASGEVGVICVACNDPNQLASTLRDARKQKVPVITYDADSEPDARDFFVNQATYDAVAQMMVDALAADMDPPGKGQVGILTSSIQAPNQSEWARRIKSYVKEKYPEIELLAETEHGEDRDLGVSKARALIQAKPDLKGIIGLTSVAVPAAAEAVRQENKKGQIAVGGVSTPRDMRDYVKNGPVKSFVLWDPVDLGYLTVHVAQLHRQGKMPKDGTIKVGRLGEIQVKDGVVLLGKPLLFNQENIDQFEF